MSTSSCRSILPAFLLLGTSLAMAQTAHYPNGVEGLKAATLPPPGIYFRDYNYGYFANEFPGGPAGFNLKVYVQAPRLIWMSEAQFLGGTYGADVLVPFVQQDLKVGAFHASDFGLGDLSVEPLLLSWHKPQYDLAVAYGIWAPSGRFDPARPLNPGKGYFGHMFTAGGTYYFDTEKTWAFSALNRFEINQENPDTKTTTGSAWTVEGGLSKTLNKIFDLGVIGYAQAKISRDRGPAAGPSDSVGGIGPELSVMFPPWMLFASARYVFEFGANDRPEGHMVNVTLTKRF